MAKARAYLQALALAGVVAAIAISGCKGSEDSEPGDVVSVASREVLARKPYMGVSCRTANSTACDRIGLSVWLREPAERVSGTIDGSRFELDDPQWSNPAKDIYAGFLQPAGLATEGSDLEVAADEDERWFGRPAVAAKVELAIERGEGERLVTEVEVPLSAGWG